jgi:predicted component of type VI protein secretion system
MLQYVFCASRIAHYIKVIGRDKIGSFRESHELSSILGNWLNKYTVDDGNASPEIKARSPLRSGEVTVREQPGKPGSFFCEMLLLPHSQFDELAVGLRFSTEVAPPRAG